jgi:hypothetical protein
VKRVHSFAVHEHPHRPRLGGFRLWAKHLSWGTLYPGRANAAEATREATRKSSHVAYS